MFRTIGKIIKYPRLTLKYPAKPMDSRFFIGKPEIDQSKCNNCGECISRCPSSAFKTDTGSGISIDLNRCLFCSLCEDVCKAGAICMTDKFELASRNIKSQTNPPFIVEDRNLPQTDFEQIGLKIKNKINRIFGRSLQIREVDAGSCNGCDYEITAVNNPINDIERFGIHFVASPRHADMLLVTGTASRNMELALIKTYNATPDPKLVVAVGACACSGGIFRDSYATRNGINTIVPVDVYIPGCPPRPQAILYGILKAIERL
ncbi:MAG: NADH-quinone oxidoreductase subunit NuoB [Bacillota bacterium]|nr:NADH-quinone oxidoreductase subunit NuoB [Bacillota bacterium]